MTIEKPRIELLNDLFNILRECRVAMEQNGIFQWTEQYPTPAVVADDIHKGHLYLFSEGGKPLGIITLNEVQDEEYKQIPWTTTEGKMMVIHRLAVHPLHQGQQIARQLMDFAEGFAADNGYSAIRLDAYTGNERALRFYENRGYAKRGEVRFPGRTLPFYCYEKSVAR